MMKRCKRCKLVTNEDYELEVYFFSLLVSFCFAFACSVWSNYCLILDNQGFDLIISIKFVVSLSVHFLAYSSYRVDSPLSFRCDFKFRLNIFMCPCVIDLIGVYKTVTHCGYSDISRETNLLSEEINLYISQETFLCCMFDVMCP